MSKISEFIKNIGFFFYGVIIIISINPEPVNAALTVGNLKTIYSLTGKIYLSVDAGASNSATYTIDITKPDSDATIIKAFLFGSSTNKPEDSDLETNYGIQLNSNHIEWNEIVIISTIQEHLDKYDCKPVTPYTRNFFNMYADVTNLIKSLDLNPGINSVTISQVVNDSNKIIQGCSLIVVFENPLQAEEKTIRILFSNNFDQPFAKGVPINYRFEIPLSGFNLYNQDSFMNMGLGISNGCQPKIDCLQNQCNDSADSQYGIHSTVVKVNGHLLTTIAGGQDDGGIFDQNGEGYLTVGGINDNTQNPDIALSVDNKIDSRSDDELYSLKPFIHDNLNKIVVTTENESKNDNLFLAYVEYSYAPDTFDRDNDGVINEWDKCDNTNYGACTDNEGCDCLLFIVSDFENGSDGWSDSGGILEYQDGYIMLTDEKTYDYMSMIAPQKFLGDLTSFNGGILSFDANLIQTTDDEEPFVPQFGIITFTSATGKEYTLDIIQSDPIKLIPPASNYHVQLNATDWNVDESEWIQLLSNVASIKVTLESVDNTVETMGFDNFMLKANVCMTQADLNNIADKAVQRERFKWDINGDNEIGLEDVIHYLEILSGVVSQDESDSDGDGVIDTIDECQNTLPGLCTNNKGCLCDVYSSELASQCSTLDQLNQKIEESVAQEKSKWDLLNDNKIGLPEIIHALTKISHLDQGLQTWFKDADNDGYSDGLSQEQVNRPTHYKLSSELVSTFGDCNDNNASVHPDATEICNGQDDNCDGVLKTVDVLRYWGSSMMDSWTTTSEYSLQQEYSYERKLGEALCEVDNINVSLDDTIPIYSCMVTYPKDALYAPYQDQFISGKQDHYLRSSCSEGVSSDFDFQPVVSTPIFYLYKSSGPNRKILRACWQNFYSNTLESIESSCSVKCDESQMYYVCKGYGDDYSDADCACGEVGNGLWFLGYIINDNATWYKDIDGDKYSDGKTKVQEGRPLNYYLSSELIALTGDCDDANPYIHPGREEYVDDPDNTDENCDGRADIRWYKDFDNDDYTPDVLGDDENPIISPIDVQPKDNYRPRSEITENIIDCNDLNPNINPGMEEIVGDPDNTDENCDGHADIRWYKDFDNDDYTPDANPTIAPIDVQPGDKYRPGSEIVENKIDCDDLNPNINPGKEEYVDDDDNTDENCDGHADIRWYKDFDKDAYTPDVLGDDENPIISALNVQPRDNYRARSEIVENKIDCDDDDETIHPDAEEVCDGEDNDCDGQIDEDVLRQYCNDADDDGHGEPGNYVYACSKPPNTAWTKQCSDCNDNDDDVYPGADEICDGKDNDCDGQIDEGLEKTWYKDYDNDKYSDGTKKIQCSRPTYYRLETELTSTSGDCDDNNAALHPKTIWYKDKDNDKYSDGNTIMQCTRPTYYKLETELLSTSGDCHDTNAAINPKTVWYKDSDNDKYSDGTTKTQCSRPSGYKLKTELTAISGDCDDSESSVYPGAAELCDGLDNNCDGKRKEIDIIRYWGGVGYYDHWVTNSSVNVGSDYTVPQNLGKALCEPDGTKTVAIYSCQVYVASPPASYVSGKYDHYLRTDCSLTDSPNPQTLNGGKPIFYLYKDWAPNRTLIQACFFPYYSNTFETNSSSCQSDCSSDVCNECLTHSSQWTCTCDKLGWYGNVNANKLGYTSGY